jgi:threonine aldolase
MRARVDFRSDNVGAVSPEILKALESANTGPAAAYGEDDWTRHLNERFSGLFETTVTVFPVATGTAANAIALSTLTPPYGTIFCHEAAHVHTSEAGATEFFSGGAKLTLLGGAGYRLNAAELDQAVASSGRDQWHRAQPAAVSVTQATEFGTVYRLNELAAIGEVAHRSSLRFHMDGARFANALATLGCTPADMTWRLGLDALSFGATKNGGMNAEAIVVFTPELIKDLRHRLRRSGQTWSKMRFAAAQLIAYVEDDLFLRSARQANTLATQLAEGLARIPHVTVIAPVEANEVFLQVPPRAIDWLAAEGFLFSRRSPDLIRLVCRVDGSEEEIRLFLAAVQRFMERL